MGGGQNPAANKYLNDENIYSANTTSASTNPASVESHSTNPTNDAFVIFLDSDDFLEDSALESLAEIIRTHNKIEWILCNSAYHHGTSKELHTQIFFPQSFENSVYSSNEILCAFPHIHLYAVWQCVLSMDFIMRHNCAFEPNIYFEDVLFMQQILSYSQRLFIAPQAIYHYRVAREGSIMNTRSHQRELKATYSHFVLAKRFLQYHLASKHSLTSAYFLHWTIFFAKEVLRHIEVSGYIKEIGFTQDELKAFVLYLPYKYRFCYAFPRIYGLPKRIRQCVARFVGKI